MIKFFGFDNFLRVICRTFLYFNKSVNKTYHLNFSNVIFFQMPYEIQKMRQTLNSHTPKNPYLCKTKR
jgi:hypothetical protein